MYSITEAYLEKLCHKAMKNRAYYWWYIALRLPFSMAALLRQEGFFGMGRFLFNRAEHLIRNVPQAGQPAFYQQPVRKFTSRHGFQLYYIMDYIVYDEIFLVGAYLQPQWQKDLRESRHPLALDLGTHHGVFTNYVKSINPATRVFGAEISPANFQRASTRLAVYPDVKVLPVGIAHQSGTITLHFDDQSTVNSILQTTGKQQAEARLVTLDEFAAMTGLPDQEITVIKMDIEGAEEQLLLEMTTARATLKRTRNLILEIHRAEVGENIHQILERETGLRLIHQRRLNFFYTRS
jgi:FkbM family methyltransferase